MEHTHGLNKGKGQGGHYHYDTTPDEIEYIGYFNVAECKKYIQYKYIEYCLPILYIVSFRLLSSGPAQGDSHDRPRLINVLQICITFSKLKILTFLQWRARKIKCYFSTFCTLPRVPPSLGIEAVFCSRDSPKESDRLFGSLGA